MSKARILIVEDEAIVAADLAGRLGQLGYEISGTTGRGEDAIKHVRVRHPDLILMDIHLAGVMDGVEAAEIIRCEFDLPVIYLTAHSDRATLERAKLTKPFGYIVKPFEEHGLESHIEMALFKHRAERNLRQAHDELEYRVQERTTELKAAEKALREINETLEKRVAERTAELQAANTALLNSRRAALNLMEDAVTARRQAEEINLALQESKGNLQLFIEYAPAALAMFDREMRYIHASRRWRNDFHLGNQELRGVSHYDVFPEFSTEWEEAHRRGLAGEVVRAEADRFVRSDGSVQWVRWEIRPWQNAVDEVGGIVIFAEDITDVKQAEEALRRYELLAGNSRDIILFIRRDDGRILEANVAAMEGYGYDHEELLGLTIQGLRISDNSELAAAQMMEADTQGILFEAIHCRKDGSTFPVEVSSRGATIGGTRMLLSVIRDITDRKRVEEALRESEKSVRRKLDSILSPEGDIGNLDLADIIDARPMQLLMDNFYKLTHIPMGLIDLKGEVLVGVGWQDVCTKFHRSHPQACKNCIESDTLLSGGVLPGEYKLYKCKNNMWDAATPIIVGGKQFGNFFMGQFFFEDEPLDYELFRVQAKEYGFAEQEYIAALERVPRLSRAVLATGMAYFTELADMISRMGYSNLKLARSLTERDTLLNSLQTGSARLDLLAETASQLLRSDSPQEVVDSLCQKVMVFLDCHAFFNFLVDEKEGRLYLNACAGIPDEEKKKIEWLDYGVAVCGCVARDSCRIVAEDISNTSDARTDLVKSYGILAYACHPLMAQGQLLGTLSFGTRTRISFTEEELSLMNAVADQVAIAMERKRAEEALRRAHDELEMRVGERTEELALTVTTLRGEIAERELAEASLNRLNRIYAVLSEIDQAIVRASDRDTLFHDFCSIAVEQGGFLLCWVGVVAEEGGHVRVSAACGATGYLDDIHVSAREDQNGIGPTGLAIRHGTYYICNDFQNDPCTRPWHERGRVFGIRASAAVALKEEGRVIGALTLYAAEQDFFDQQHLALLVQMGADVSFALDNMVREVRRRETERALREETLERLQALEALREKDRLLIQQSRLAAMGEMINNIAHQWRQPLNILGLNIQRVLLFYDMGDFDREFLQTSTNDAMKLITHMSQTIDDFRNFFKSDKAKSVFSVNQAIQLTVSLVIDGFKNNQIEIVTQIHGDPQINGYYNEFCQVLLNLLQNARDVIVERKIAGGKVIIASSVNNGRTVITITDNAGGIPEDILGKIFEPYFSTKGVQGTGIGLFMSKNIIETNMGGSITAHNTAHGAEFRLEV